MRVGRRLCPDCCDKFDSAWRSFMESPEEQRRQGNLSADTRQRNMKAAFVENIDKAAVYERDGGICQLCGQPIGKGKWHIDHATPISKGGKHSYDNVQLAHARCNLSKGAKKL